MIFVQSAHNREKRKGRCTVFGGGHEGNSTIYRGEKSGVKKQKMLLTNEMNFARIRRRRCGAA